MSVDVVSVATPAEPRGERKALFAQILGGEKLLESAGEKCFKRSERGLKHFRTRFGPVDTEFPYRVPIADKAYDCRDPACPHCFRP